MNDLISRQAAIDALGKEGLITAMVIVDRLPSAQPEIIMCKDCKWNMGDCCCFETYAASVFDENGFCSNAERGYPLWTLKT